MSTSKLTRGCQMNGLLLALATMGALAGCEDEKTRELRLKRERLQNQAYKSALENFENMKLVPLWKAKALGRTDEQIMRDNNWTAKELKAKERELAGCVDELRYQGFLWDEDRVEPEYVEKLKADGLWGKERR